jgi:hypothetical protein
MILNAWLLNSVWHTVIQMDNMKQVIVKLSHLQDLSNHALMITALILICMLKERVKGSIRLLTTMVTVLQFIGQTNGIEMSNQDMYWLLKMITVHTGTLSCRLKESIF